MGERINPEVAIVGAGPYGLSVAAHLRAAGVKAQVFGRPLSFWRAMPPQMSLRSPWSASSLSDPGRRFDLDAYIKRHGIPRQEPVPISLFLDYGDWFRDYAVGEVDPASVSCIEEGKNGFTLQISDGREIGASRVVIATGVQGFANLPDFADRLPRELAAHTGEQIRFDDYRGLHVGVIGAGQSALETAVFLHEHGADVEVITRGPVRWADRRLYEMGGLVRTVFYPPADVGPVGLNWLVSFPSVFRLLPTEPRGKLTRRAVRPSGAKWLKDRFEPGIHATTFVDVVSAEATDGGVKLVTSDGVTRHFDRLVFGTGYRPDVGEIPILGERVRCRIQRSGRYPRLNRHFESSLCGLHFVGAIASGSFGPLCKFVAGADYAARAVARAAA